MTATVAQEIQAAWDAFSSATGAQKGVATERECFEAGWRTALGQLPPLALRLDAGYGGSGNRRAGYLVYYQLRRNDEPGNQCRMLGWVEDDGSEPDALRKIFPTAVVVVDIPVNNSTIAGVAQVGRRTLAGWGFANEIGAISVLDL